MRIGINVIISVLFLLLGACDRHSDKPSPKSPASPPPAPVSPPPEQSQRTAFYSEKYLFHVRYPDGVRIEAAEDGESFFVMKAKHELDGKVWGEENEHGISAAKRCEERIRTIGLTAVPYKVIKEDWYVFSGIVGDEIVYEKGLMPGVVKTLHMRYSAISKEEFDPIVTAIAKSFESYEVLTGKVSMVTPFDRRKGEDTGGALWFESKPTDAHNVRTICYYSPQHIEAFDSLREGQTITVAGYPKDSTIRESSDLQSGLYQHAIKNCVITAR